MTDDTRWALDVLGVEKERMGLPTLRDGERVRPEELRDFLFPEDERVEKDD